MSRYPAVGAVNCGHCGSTDTKVKDSRVVVLAGTRTKMRRRQCQSCGANTVSYEVTSDVAHMLLNSSRLMDRLQQLPSDDVQIIEALLDRLLIKRDRRAA